MEPFTGTPRLVQPNVYNALVVDDDEFDRQRIRRFSEKTELPIYLHEVSSIDKMQEAVSKTRFDLILLDYQLADGDGLDALTLVQGNKLQSETGIIMVTGNEHADVAAAAFRNGCHDFISKSAMSINTMKTAMLRTLDQIEHTKSRGSSPGNIEQEVERALLSSLSGPSGQLLLSKALRQTNQAVVSDVEIVHELEVQAFVEALEDDDEFRFIN